MNTIVNTFKKEIKLQVTRLVFKNVIFNYGKNQLCGILLILHWKDINLKKIFTDVIGLYMTSTILGPNKWAITKWEMNKGKVLLGHFNNVTLQNCIS